MKIGVVGGGVVGHATARAFMEWSDGGVKVYDDNPARRTHPLVSKRAGEAVLDCDIVFVCLPTPQREGSSACDLSTVEGFFRELLNRGDVYPNRVREVNFVLRSTVPVGTTKYLAKTYGYKNLVHSPEFLTARCAVVDAQTPARNIIGYPDYVPIPENTACHPLRDLYARRFNGVQTIEMMSDESEFVKLAVNSFFAVKVALFNEFRAYADKIGLDWSAVTAGILSDGRIAHSHTQVPGPDGKFGFGGECLPKDLASLIHCIDSAKWKADSTTIEEGDLEPYVCRAALNRNEYDRQRGKE